MILIISAIVLFIGILFVVSKYSEAFGVFLIITSILGGFFMLGLIVPIYEKDTVINPAKIEKNELGVTVYYMDNDRYTSKDIKLVHSSDIRLVNSTNNLVINKRLSSNSYTLPLMTEYTIIEK